MCMVILTYWKGRMNASTIPEMNRTMQKTNSTPWYDVTSNWTNRWHHTLLWWGTAWKSSQKRIFFFFSDLCLKAEDGDKETNCCCDAQTQHHRLGVVETVKKKMSRINDKCNVTRRCRTKSYKVTTWENIGVPGQHSCHVGEWQGLEWDTKVDIYKISQNLNLLILPNKGYTSTIWVIC